MRQAKQTVDTEKDVRTIRTADGRSTVKVLVLSTSASGQLLNVLRIGGTGYMFVCGARQVVSQ